MDGKCICGCLLHECWWTISCGREEPKGFFFPRTIEPTGESLGVDSLYMTYPYRLELADSVLIVMDLHGTDCFYHALSYPGLKYESSFGRKGKGPREITACTPMTVRNGRVYVWDGSKSTLLVYPLSALDEEDSVRRVSFEGKLPAAVDMAVVDDSTVVLGNLTGESRLILLPASGEAEKMFSLPAQEDGTLPDPKTGYLWRAFLSYSPESGKAALATQFGEVLEIYDLTDSTQQVSMGAGGVPSARKGNAYGSVMEGFCDVKWIGDKIYALFSGRSREEKEEAARSDSRIEGGNRIYVFDAKGRPETCYLLDRFIDGLTVDTTGNRIVGVTTSGELPFVLFDLPVR